MLTRTTHQGITTPLPAVRPDGFEATTDDCHDVHMSTPVDAAIWPARTDRLTLRPATPDDLDATWAFRRLENVSSWLTGAPTTIEEYRARFADPDSLAKTLPVSSTAGHR